MHTVPESIPDELPTRPCLATPSRMLVFASRIDRLAELALERLAVAHDPDALAAALDDLVTIRDLCSGAMR